MNQIKHKGNLYFLYLHNHINVNRILINRPVQNAESTSKPMTNNHKFTATINKSNHRTITKYCTILKDL